jgi:hypothetical protein
MHGHRGFHPERHFLFKHCHSRPAQWQLSAMKIDVLVAGTTIGFPTESVSEFEPEVSKNERSCGKFRRNEEEDAERASLRVAPHIPAHKADDGFKLSVRDRVAEAVRESCR